jgi:hypothetical protein
METTDHIARPQLYPLVWAIKDRPPPREGEGADPELARSLSHLAEGYQRELAPEHRLGPETVDRLLAHTKVCSDCRMMLLEDGPDAAPPRTAADAAAETARKEAERQAKVRRFYAGAAIGLACFIGFQVLVGIINRRAPREPGSDGTAAMQVDPRDKAKKEIDPLWYASILLVIGFAVCTADAYMIARELWIDFSRWKRAVPIIGKKWAEGEKDIHKG